MSYDILTRVSVRYPAKPQKTSFDKEELIEMFQQRDYADALFLSSPQLSKQFQKHLLEGTMQLANEKFYLSLAKYALRMHNRCTPFGLMAGCGVSEMSENLILDLNRLKIDVSLDSACTEKIAEFLSNHQTIKLKIKFHSNNSIYKFGREIRYTYCENIGNFKKYELSTLGHSSHLNMILKHSKLGSTFKTLTSLLSKTGIELEDATKYIDELIDNSLLISDLTPSVIGNNQFNYLLDKLIALENIDDISRNLIKELKNIQHLLVKMSNRHISLIDGYEKISQIFKNINIPIDHERLIKADLYSNPIPANYSKLPTALTSDLLNATSVLDKLTRRNYNRYLHKFIQRFQERYEDQEIPLAVALDNDLGLGYGNFDTSGTNKQSSGEGAATWGEIDKFLLSKLLGSIKNNESTIYINIDELEEITADPTNPPPSMFAHYCHFKGNSNDYNILLKYIGGPSAINLIGRFGQSEEIHQIMTEVANMEEKYHQDSIVAEICHSPQFALGNVLHRTSFRNYEIPYLTPSTLPIEKQIYINDLLVSIRNGKLYLRSKNLNKEIIPRLSNSHQFSKNTLPVYHFLCDFQFSNQKPPFYFNWGAIGNGLDYLPRVQVGKIIISPAKWQISKDQITRTLKNPSPNEIRAWLKSKAIPDIFYMIDSDSEILIDTRSDLSISILISIMKKLDPMIFTEYFYAESGSFLQDKEGNSYANESVAFFTLNEQKTVKMSSLHENVGHNIARKFSLGSEWLSYKLYCGKKIAEDILKSSIGPLTKTLTKQGLIDKWFFLRYSDADFHIRIRLHLPNRMCLQNVINQFEKSISKFVGEDKIWKIQNETYNRELERYSMKYINQVESLFYFDSQCILGCLGDKSSELNRFELAFRLVEDTMKIFEIDISSFCDLHNPAFSNEFKNPKYEMDKMFRARKKRLFTLLSNPGDIFSRKVLHEINLRKKKFENLLETNNFLKGVNRSQIASSIIHMSVNRIFKDFNRQQEALIYQMLSRHYRSVKYLTK